MGKNNEGKRKDKREKKRYDKRKLKNEIDIPDADPEYYEDLMDEYLEEDHRSNRKQPKKSERWG